MLRLRRTKKELALEFHQPLDDKHFSDLHTTLLEFIKIGKKHFCYDFKFIEDISEEEARAFEEGSTLLEENDCILKMTGANNKVLQRLPRLNRFVKKTKNTVGQFRLECRLINKISLLNLSGEFMENDALEEFKAKSSQFLEVSRGMVINCQELSFISTLAVGSFVHLKKEADKAGKKLVICNVPKVILSSLEMAGISNIIPILATVESAQAYAYAD